MRTYNHIVISFFAIILLLNLSTHGASSISGELKQWHKVTLEVDGPHASETGDPNPFLDYRMQVTFRHLETGLVYNIPGYFAADGDAANSSASEGKKWRAHLSPDHKGQWSYLISFRKGTDIAVSDDPNAGSPVNSVDGLDGKFNVSKSDKTGRDLRSKGRLKYVGKHHLQFAGTGEFFLKAGVDAPENLLSYRDFDGDFKTDGHKDNLIKDWTAHVKDWKKGDPTWQDGKGKGLIGVINYLESQGLNSFSFLTMNIEGDDRNVFPYLTYDERERLDCSRLDQWEIIFGHGTKLGMYLHFKTLEAENTLLLDDGHLGKHRKLYYRELIARFGHHLALNWNLGEEVGYVNKVSTEMKQSWSEYFKTHDPYHHHMVIHNGNNHYDLLGNASALTGFSLQTSRTDFSQVHNSTLNYLRRSLKAGKPWVVACDEPGDATHSLITDEEDPTHDTARMNALWGNILAGGAGIEWYFGYAHPHSDLTCQDFRVRENMWKQCRIALDFFTDHNIPFWNMSNSNEKISTKDGYCLSQSGQVYLVYLKHAQSTTLDLSGTNGIFEILWYNPREGGSLKSGSTIAVKGNQKVSLGNPPIADGKDWLALIRPGDPERDYPPGISIKAPKKVMLPASGNSIKLDLKADLSDDRTPVHTLVSQWFNSNDLNKVHFSSSTEASTQVTLTGSGDYTLKLRVSDGQLISDEMITIKVEPYQSRVTRSIKATEDAYIEGTNTKSDPFLKIENNRRIGFVKFDLQELPPNILDVQLRLTTSQSDSGNGTLRVLRGSHSDWTSKTLKKGKAPKPKELLGSKSVSVASGDSVTIPVKKLISGEGSHTLIITLDAGGNDIWFNSSRTDAGPELLITFEDPDGRYSSFGNSGNTDSSLTVLRATSDFKPVIGGEFIPSYIDKRQNALAIDATRFKGKFAAAESKFQGSPGTYDLVLTTLTETDGESVYRLIVNGKVMPEVKNKETSIDYKASHHRFDGITMKQGDIIRVEFNSASNGKIPEGNAFAYARGRWTSVTILKPGTPFMRSNNVPQ